MQYFVGIDPGLEGAIVVLCGIPYMVELEIFDMPVISTQLSKRKQMRVDGQALWQLLESWRGRNIVIAMEHLWGFGTALNNAAEKGQFSFADDYGLIRGLLIASEFKVIMVPPQKWQSRVGKEKCSDKTGSIKRAIELYPQHNRMLIKPGARTYSDGRSDALLIAHYCSIVASQ